MSPPFGPGRSHRSPATPVDWRLPPAIVVGLDNITGLQSARILAERGVPVVGVAASRNHWAAHTNTCVEVVEADLAGVGLVASLQQLGARLGRTSVLIPCSDLTVQTLSRYRDDLAAHFVLALAPHRVVDLLMDKAGFARHAEATGLPVPRTAVLGDRSDTAHVAATFSYPCVLKPSVKTVTWAAHTGAKGFTVRGPDHLLAVYDTVAGWSPQVVVQEWVEGPVDSQFTCNCYFDGRGEPLVTFVTRKLRQWPPAIGTGSAGEECRNDEVRETTVRLFRSVRFRGLGYLEMKRDQRTGRLLVIEPNVGRPTGRSATAEAGGVELLHTAYCDATGLPLPDAREQRYVGAKWVDLRRDAQAAVVGRHRGTLDLVDWARWMRGPKAHAIWSRSDPVPFAVDLLQATRKGARKLRTRGDRHPGAGAPEVSGPPVLDTPDRARA